MADKSVGQWVGYIVGAVVGYFTGGVGWVAFGAAVGGAAGYALDPPKGPSLTGPRLDDQSFTSSSLGAPLARGYGTFPVTGNIVWLEGDRYREVTQTESSGGKGGGGGAEYTTYKYYATFAVSLLRVTDPDATVALRRLWVGSNLVYDAGSDNLESIIASNTQASGFTFYNGSDDQTPNPRWQADKGVNAVSGFPGRCYIVFNDLDLEPYSRTLAMAQVKAELVITTPTVDVDLAHDLDGLFGSTSGRDPLSVVATGSGSLGYGVCDYDVWSGNLTATEFHDLEVAVSDIQSGGYSLSGFGYSGAPHLLYVCDADRPVVMTLQGYDDGFGNAPVRLRIHDAGGSVATYEPIPNADVPYVAYSAAVDNDYIALFKPGYPVIRMANGEFVTKTAANYSINKGGLSDNYFFGVYESGYPQTTTVVYKFDRDTLALVDTYTQSVPGTWAAIRVISDDEFYTMAENHVYRWLGGVVVEDLGAIASFGSGDGSSRTWFFVSTMSPAIVYNVVERGAPAVASLYVGHQVVDDVAASLRDIVTAECALAGVAAADLDLSGLVDHDVRGYRVTQRGSVRAALEPLQARFPFDVAASGYKLRFVSRGGASLATIPEEDLGAAATGEKASVLLPVAREMDTQLATRISARYLDPGREYDLGEQYAERAVLNSVNERVLDLPLVLTADEAAQTADILLAKEWVERVEIGPFDLPPTWWHIEAADVVTVEHRGQAHEVRITRAEYLPDGRVTCSAKLTSPQAYTSTATGENPDVPGQSLVPLRGSSTGLLLDIPTILEGQDRAGVAAAAYGLASGWPGATILRSDDSGSSYQGVLSTNTAAAVFRATSALATGRTDIIDATNVMTVEEVSRNPSLSSVSFASAAAGQNLAALGADGRWEIVSFLTVVDNADDTWTLNDFVRGRFGTEWAMALHEAGDLLVMLSLSSVGFIGLPVSALNSPRLYRTVTQGANLDAAADVSFPYGGVNLRPLSPIRLNGSRHPTSGDWSLSWTRRSRTPVEPFSGVATPLGEAAESYDVEICNSDYSAIYRTFSALSSSEVVYTAAQQVSDQGAQQSTLYVRVYQNSTIVGRGEPLESSITRVMEEDQYLGFVTMLLHMDAAALSDECGHSVTLNGSVARSSAQSKFGGYSAAFAGYRDYLALGSGAMPTSGDFFFEGAFYLNSLADYQTIIRGDNSNYFDFGVTAAGAVVIDRVGTTNICTTATGLVTAGSMICLAFGKEGNTWRIWVQDGTTMVLRATGTYAFTPYEPSTIGYNAFSAAFDLDGYGDEMRWTSFNRHTTDYPTPVAPFPNP